MAIELKSKTRTVIMMIVYTLAFLGLELLSGYLEKVHMTNFNGLVLALQYGMCLLLIRCDRIRGVIISMILMGLAMINIVRAMIFFNPVVPLPGFVNIIFYAVTLVILGKHFIMREREASTDFLTGLLNRRGLYDLLIRTIENEKPFNVVYIDLGNFKFINDSYGHAAGDRLLRTIADRMEKVVGDLGTITRIGGDEFVIVLDGSLDPKKTADAILGSIRERASLDIDGSRIDCYLTCYAGIASYPDDTKDYESLIKYADIAMYQATKEKSEEPCFFNSEMAEFMTRQMELEKLIKEGLEHDYFYLVYQPQYKLSGKKLRGFESLLRMKTADGAFVSPAEFIPVAEKGDLILRIDDYVLHRAMNEFRQIVLDSADDLTVSVNVSAKNIGSLDFPDRIKNIIEETGFPAEHLEIEITEYCLVQSVDITIDNIRKLRSMGVQVALDDFGTGYTSLNYLAKMPINILKVDKSLVDDIEKNQKSRDFVHAVISMGHLMGCELISEGVENESQLALLSGQECDFVQGYVWGRPMKYSDAKELSLK